MGSRRQSAYLMFASLIALGGTPACGDFVESGGAVTRLTVGTVGGTLATDQLALNVPVHALTTTVTLTAARAGTDAPASRAYTVGPDHVTFDGAAPAEVTIHYDGALHPHPVDVFAAVQTGGAWHVLTRPAGDTGTAGVARGVTTMTGTFGAIDCPAGVCP